VSKLRDFRNGRTLSQHTDEEIELIITGGAAFDEDLAEFASFLANIREEVVTAPTPAEVDRFARRAAAIARSTHRPTPVTRPGRNRVSLSALRTHAATAVATVALAVFSALGLTANAAVPGDLLYGLDLAMEKVGIGNGSLQERLNEAAVLIDRGDQVGAIELLSSAISETPDANPEVVSAAVDTLTELTALHENNAGGNSDNNAGGNAGGNSDNTNAIDKGNPDNNAGGNPDNNASDNAGGNPDNNASDNAGGNPDNNASDNAGGSDNNASDNAGGNPDNNASDNAGGSDNNASRNNVEGKGNSDN